MAAMDEFNQHPVVHTWSYKLDQAAGYNRSKRSWTGVLWNKSALHWPMVTRPRSVNVRSIVAKASLSGVRMQSHRRRRAIGDIGSKTGNRINRVMTWPSGT
jgi:hypothetical protein